MIHTELATKPNKIEAAEKIPAVPELLNSTEQLSPARVLGAQVCASIEELWRLYPERRHGSTTHVGGRIVEVEGVAMRDYEQRWLEEVIVRSRVYDTARKDEHGPLEALSVHIKTEDGEELITVDASGEADVHYRDISDDPGSEWRNMPFQRATRTVEDLSYRALIAAVRHGSRSPEEKARANAHAKSLLHERFPLFARSETSLE